MSSISQQIANELAVSSQQVQAAIALLDDGATVPFIARYRKEATGGLDDTQLRNLAQRLTYLRELNDRREVILASIRDQEKLTPELERQIRSTESKLNSRICTYPTNPNAELKARLPLKPGLNP